MRIKRIIAVIVIGIAIYFGYRFIVSNQEKNTQDIYQKYASVISEVSIAAELYRNDPDSFFMARDSILNLYNLSIDSINAFRDELEENNLEFVKVWEYVKNITDSLVDDRIDKIKSASADTISDSI